MNWLNSLVGDQQNAQESQNDEESPTLAQYLKYFDKLIPSSPKKAEPIINPFTDLPSVQMISNILSYLGYKDEIHKLLNLLSKST